MSDIREDIHPTNPIDTFLDCADSLATSAVRSEAGNVVCPNDPSVICGGELASGDSIVRLF